MKPKNLNELYEMMKNDDPELEKLYGDWSSLPVFGGSEPKSTIGVWSWDENNLIVGMCSYDIKIISRDVASGRA